MCADGVCAGAQKDCADTETCTTDSCDAATGDCVNDGTPHEGAGCDDGDLCTETDVCTGGVCGGAQKDCADSETCTTDSCDAATGDCVNDGGPHEGTGCDDGDLCTETDVCADGVCAGAQKDCADTETCTTDSCDAATGDCVNDGTPHEGAGCDDGDLCTETDVCASGVCGGAEKDCADTEACTTDSCDAATGDCVNDGGPNEGSGCDDGNPCTDNDVCTAGECLGQGQQCDDGNPCTADSCDGATQQCVFDPIPQEGASCTDADLCTQNETCQAGVCTGPVDPCDDTDVCTADSCDPATGACIHDAPGADGVSCDDSDACTFADSCSGGACDGIVIDCEDFNDCTADSCDLATGMCVHDAAPMEGSGCDDGASCTTATTCSAGECLGTVNCADPACLPAAGCVPPANSVCAGAPIIASLPFSVTDDTRFYGSDYASTCPGVALGGTSPEGVWQFVAPVEGSYRFATLPSPTAGDTLIYLTEGCPDDPTHTCVASADSFGKGDDEIFIDLTTGTDLFVVVDGYSDQTWVGGPFTLQVSLLGPKEITCDDNVDNDGNGLTDCEDIKCQGVPACPAAENCLDDLDNDGDGYIDCYDSDCSSAPVCASGNGETCSAAFMIDTLPFTDAGDTTGAANDYVVTCAGGQDLGGDSADLVYEFQVPFDATYRFSLAAFPGAMDSVLYLVTGCPGTTCVAYHDKANQGGGEQIDRVLQAGSTVYVVVDGWVLTGFGYSEEGPYELTVQVLNPGTETDCDDGTDNDGDGDVDCADSTCAPTPTCLDPGPDTCALGANDIDGIPFIGTGDTSYLDADYAATCPAAGSGSGSRDAAYKVPVPADGIYRFELTSFPGAMDSLLYVTNACPSVLSHTCLGIDDAAGAGGEVVEVPLARGSTAYAIVDGWSDTADVSGPYELTINFVSSIEVSCSDGVDNDGDGSTDCADVACHASALCGNQCSQAIIVGGVPFTYAGDTSTRTNKYREACGGSFLFGLSSPDAVFLLDPPQAGTYRISLTSNLFALDASLYVTEGCPNDGGHTCLGLDEVAGGGGESITLPLNLNQQVFITVDGFDDQSLAEGAYELHIELLP